MSHSLSDPVPSKDVSELIAYYPPYQGYKQGREVVEQGAATICMLLAEVERLRTVLAGIASCSTCEACRGAATLALGDVPQPPSPIPFAGVAKGVSYEALANATYPERMYGGDSPAVTMSDWLLRFDNSTQKLELNSNIAADAAVGRLIDLFNQRQSRPAHEPAREYPDPVTAFENLAAALPPGFEFPTMEADTSPLTHQEIFSAVHHHASEIVRLTAAVPAQCSPQPPEAGQ